MHLLIILTLLPFLIKSYEIKATGGGIVPLGSDLELSLVVGKVWDRCRWFLYEHHADYQYCSFDLDADTGVAEVSIPTIYFYFCCFSQVFLNSLYDRFPNSSSIDF